VTPILKRYEDFIETLLRTTEKLKEQINQVCKDIGCDRGEDRFMECGQGCPLFYAWTFLEKLENHIKEEEK
jgi:hypothetical protein